MFSISREDANEVIAKLLGWYKLGGAWIHPDGYAKSLPDFVKILFMHGMISSSSPLIKTEIKDVP